jgi:hypothetical protein
VTRSDNGLFFPYEFLADASKAARRGYPELEPLFAQRRKAFSAMLELVESYREPLRLIGPDPAPQPRWAQNWFPPLDAAVAYALTRHHKPATIIEVGGGHSSRFFVRAARDQGIAPHHVVIDPGARAKEKITGLPVENVPRPLEVCDLSIFSRVKSGDIVSLDGSHKLLPGSDVDVFVGRVLPQLPAGVLVHIHDCFLPDGYPAAWDNRVYNEQSAFLALVLSRDWPCVFASHYVSTRMAGEVARGFVGGFAAQSEATPTSLWFTKANA